MKKVLSTFLAICFVIGIYAQHPSGRSYTKDVQSNFQMENLSARKVSNNVLPKAPTVNPAKIMDQPLALAAAHVEVWECLDASSNQERYSTVSKKVWWKEGGYLIDSVEYTIYKKDLTVDKTVKIRTGSLLTNDVRIQPEHSRMIFNTGSSDREFVVFVHYWHDSIDPKTQNFKHLVINENGETMFEYDSTAALMLYYNPKASGVAQRKFITAQYVNYGDKAPTNTDSSTFVVYAIPNTRIPAVMATHRIGTKNMVGFNAPMIGLKTIEKKGYYYFPHYEKPFNIGTPADGQTTADNKGTVTLYDCDNGDVYKNFSLPMPKWSNFMQISFDVWFGEYNLTTGVFDDDEKMDIMYGLGEYISQGDKHNYTYYVVNEDGQVVKTMDRSLSESSTAVKLADIPGHPTQYAVLEASGAAISMFEPDSWTYGASFGLEHQGEKITSAINRIPEGDSYAYLIGMYQTEEDNESRYSVINFYNKNAEKIKSTKLNMGPLGAYTDMIFTPSTLNPYVVNYDGKREYIAMARTYDDASENANAHNSIYIFSEDGDMLYRADDYEVTDAPSAKLSGAQGYWSIDGGKTQQYFVLSYSNSQTYFYKLPFATMSGEGTETNPYLISEAGQLNAIRNNPSAHYKIINDIDMASFCNYSDWEAISDFAGSLDGQNHAIKNLTLKSSGNMLSLFATLKNNAKIQNIRVENGAIVVNGNTNVGFIASATDGAANILLKNIHVTGTISGTGGPVIGGILADAVGVNNGGATDGPKIEQCSFDGDIAITGSSNSYGIGGVVGRLRANVSVSNCFSQGSINVSQSGNNTGVGGVVGHVNSASIVTNCYSTMDITGQYLVGGVVGYFNEQGKSKGVVTNCYSTGRITALGTNARTFAGGVIGSSSDNTQHIEIMMPNSDIVVKKKTLTMSGLVALNDSVLTSSSTATSSRRVVGLNNNAQNNFTDFGMYTFDSIKDCYSISSLAVGKVGEATTVSSTNNGDYNGADVTTSGLTQSFYTGIGWKFGEDANNPWQWVTGKNPKLWYELKVSAVSLDRSSIDLYVDSIVTLTATVFPVTATNKNVTWMSDAPNIASVSSTGTVTAKAKGSANIFAITEEGEFEASCVVTVKNHVYTITASCGDKGKITPNGEISIEKGNSQTFTFAPTNAALYVVSKVLIDEVNDTAAVTAGSYTFSNVSANHKIAVEFVLKSSITEELSSDFTIYPNPVTDVLNIKTDQTITKIIVIDHMGKIVKIQKDKNLNLQSLPTGHYIMQIHTANKIVPVKIIKE